MDPWREVQKLLKENGLRWAAVWKATVDLRGREAIVVTTDGRKFTRPLGAPERKDK